MRTIMVVVPQGISLRPWMMLLRACSLSSGATASSTSRKTMSAADFAAFSNKAVLDPGTASSERCRRGVAGSMLVKLIGDSPVETLGYGNANGWRRDRGRDKLPERERGGALGASSARS